MPEWPKVLIVSPDPSKLPQVLTDDRTLRSLCTLVCMSSISSITGFIDLNPGINAPVIVIDYNAATEGMGGGSTTLSSRQRLQSIKEHGLPNGHAPRLVIGVSTLAPFITQLKGFGCDQICSESALASTIEAALRARSPS